MVMFTRIYIFKVDETKNLEKGKKKKKNGFAATMREDVRGRCTEWGGLC